MKRNVFPAIFLALFICSLTGCHPNQSINVNHQGDVIVGIWDSPSKKYLWGAKTCYDSETVPCKYDTVTYLGENYVAYAPEGQYLYGHFGALICKTPVKKWSFISKDENKIADVFIGIEENGLKHFWLSKEISYFGPYKDFLLLDKYFIYQDEDGYLNLQDYEHNLLIKRYDEITRMTETSTNRIYYILSCASDYILCHEQGQLIKFIPKKDMPRYFENRHSTAMKNFYETSVDVL